MMCHILKLDGTILPYADEVKFLGMIFDSNLTWTKHIDDLKLKVKKSLNLLNVIFGFEWVADRKLLLRIYDALCRSKLDCGCQIIPQLVKASLMHLTLSTIWDYVLVFVLGRFEHLLKVYVDTHQLPLDLRHEELGLRYLMRIKCNPDNPSNKVICQLDASRFRPRSSTPFQIRLDKSVKDVTFKT